MKEERFQVDRLKPRESAPIQEVPPQYRITACIGSSENLDLKEKEVLDGLQQQNINYFATFGELHESKLRNAGPRSYVISPVDTDDKFSQDFQNCTGAVAIGVDKDTGENISLLTHQSPRSILKGDRDFFEDHINKALAELTSRTRPGTIDAVIVGGNYFDNMRSKRSITRNDYGDVQYEEPITLADDYKDSIKLVSQYVEKVLGIDPLVVVGPNMKRGTPQEGAPTSVWLDTQNRRVYILRPDQERLENNVSFRASKIADVTALWQNNPPES